MIKKIHHKSGKRFNFKTHINEFLVDRKETQSSEIFLVVVKPGLTTHMHQHPDMEQTFYVIRGRGSIFSKKGKKGVERKIHSIKKGDVVFMPINEWHRITCDGSSSLEYLCVNSFPRGFLPGEVSSVDHARNVLRAQHTQ